MSTMIATKFKVIQPDGTETEGSFNWPEAPSLRELKATIEPLLAVPGQDLERVAVLHEGKPTDMFVAEFSAGFRTGEGRVYERLPRNEKATAIYRANWLRQQPKADPESCPAVYGPAVLFSRRVWF